MGARAKSRKPYDGTAAVFTTSKKFATATRLSPVQRITNLIEDARRWFGDVFRAGQQIEAGAEKVEHAEVVNPTESVKPEGKIVEATKPITVGEALQQEQARRKLAPGTKPSDQARRSRGVGI